jgi:NitT/TauT family transport system permease protein
MTGSPLDAPRLGVTLRHPAVASQFPVLTLVLSLMIIWYAAAVLMNWSSTRDVFERQQASYTIMDLVSGSLNADRPLLPSPHQILRSFADDAFGYPPTSPRSLIYHSWITLSATITGFLLGGVLGVGLAVMIVHLRALQKSLLPWIICTQMVPILAIAPIIIVVLGSIGIRGLLPKSIISAYLSFFPIVVGMVKGLNSPDPMQRDLMRTWSATSAQFFWKVRCPSAIPFLFASLKVSVAIALVGAIVGELPTGVQAGLGARLLAGSYFGQTTQIWAALLAGSLLAAVLVAFVGLTERWISRLREVPP